MSQVTELGLLQTDSCEVCLVHEGVLDRSLSIERRVIRRSFGQLVLLELCIACAT